MISRTRNRICTAVCTSCQRAAAQRIEMAGRGTVFK